MILLNVLSIVALASTVVMLMLSGQEFGLQRTQRFHEATRAAVIARAGEMSASVALRRDAVEAPQIDHMRERWASVQDTEAKIAGGSFTLAVTDAQAKFNLNGLLEGGLASVGAVPVIAAALQVPPEEVERLALRIQQTGTITDLSQLRNLGIDHIALARLSQFVTLLPRPTKVNINTASEPLLAALTGNAAAARQIVAQRRRTGFITPEDIGAIGIAMPPGAAFTSDYFWVRTAVVIGDVKQVRTALIARTKSNGIPATMTIGRWRGDVPPDGAGSMP